MTLDEMAAMQMQNDPRTRVLWSEQRMMVSDTYLNAMMGVQRSRLDDALRAAQRPPPPPEPRPSLFMLGRCAVEGEADGMTLHLRTAPIVEVGRPSLFRRALEWLAGVA